ncbi:hypothetical protein Esi_0270_0042 [Ectocarpus siliculosus]|uniref:Uncharacterized protein n=1 Tax=Ectocarpus siliculosus TaxID=2880 RepID=D7FUJ2_ECTSI|nr:hypothetical protein Esi_0270_0042 [Ectocarpus siliculosus]|eukprot:CBJ31648.1 hypothetical protein Esi_0270_0042 [Ectocarpus siliculosus]
MVVAKQDQQERVLVFFRRLPGVVVDYVSTTSLDAARRSNALKAEIVMLRNTFENLQRTVHRKDVFSSAQADVIRTERAKSEADRNLAGAQMQYLREEAGALRATIDYVEESAASDRETWARTEGDLVEKLDTAEGAIAALTETVAEQQLAAQRESERSQLALRLVVGELDVSQQEAAMSRASTLAVREELESWEQDLSDTDSASVDVSLFAAERTNEGHFLEPVTCPAVDVAKLGVNDRSASHEAAERTWCQVDESKARHREMELQCLLDVGNDMRNELEDDLTLCRSNVDEARAITESYGADIEDLDSRALAVALALANNVSEKALVIDSLAHVAQGAVLRVTPAFDSEDRWGSLAGYPMVRSHLEAVQRLVLTTSSTLVEEVSRCEAAKAEAAGREAETEERVNWVKDDLIACYSDVSIR